MSCRVRRPTTCRSVTTWRPGWDARSSSGWSSRCSAGSTPATPTSCRCDATVPQLAARSCAPSGRCCGAYARSREPADPTRPPVPVFASIRGGARTPARRRGQRRRGRGPYVRDGQRAAARLATAGGSSSGPTRDAETLGADAVVLALPAAPAARLLRRGGALRCRRPGRDRLRERRRHHPRDPDVSLGDRLAGTGFLVPPVEGRSIKAATYSSHKWALGRVGRPELTPDPHVRRAASRGCRPAARRHRARRAGGPRPVGRARRAHRAGRRRGHALGRVAAAVRGRARRARRPGSAGRGRPAGDRRVRCRVRRRRDRGLHRLGGGGAPWSSRAWLGGDNGPMADSAEPAFGKTDRKATARDLNAMVRYTMWSVFRVARPFGEARPTRGRAPRPRSRACSSSSLPKTSSCAAATTWPGFGPTPTSWSGGTPRRPRRCRRPTRRSGAPRSGAPASRPGRSWRSIGRPSSTRATCPAFLADESPRDYVCVYPFVRSYEWYLLPDDERRALLAEHGQLAREFPDVRANTVSSFALGDYEWILAFEADELHRIVDLMRHLRGSETRRHVREEVPFYTGRRRSVPDLVAALP